MATTKTTLHYFRAS